MTNKNIYDSHMSYLKDEVDFDISGKYKQQGSFLNSKDFNEATSFTESKLNELYERSRMLEDVHSYANTFVRTQIIDSRSDFYDLLKTAEKERDRTKTEGYLIKEVSLKTSGKNTLKDRDGKNIDAMAVHNQLLTLEHGDVVTIKPSAFSFNREVQAFSATGNLLIDDAYRVFYMLEAPATNGVSEEIVATLPGKQFISQVISDNVKVDKYKVRLVNNGVSLQVVGDPAAGFKKTESDKVGLTLVDTSYRQVTYEYDEKRISADFWQKVGYKELAEETGTSYLFDLEKETGMAQYKEEYEAYVKAHEQWMKDKAAAEARNAAKTEMYETAYKQWQVDMKSPEIVEIFETVKEQIITGYKKVQQADTLYDGSKTTITIDKKNGVTTIKK